MKKILMSILLVVASVVLLHGQSTEKNVEKAIDSFYFEATDYYFMHQYDSAILKLDILDFLYEDNSNIKFFLGMCYFFKQDFDKSILYYESSLGSVEYSTFYQNGVYTPHIVYFYMGYAYEKKGNINRAIESYEEYIKYERDKEIIYNTKEKVEAMKLFHNINY